MYADDDVLPEESAELFEQERVDVLTPLDPEFHYVISDPRLSAELAGLRESCVEPTTAFRDGSARERRDRRIAQRALACVDETPEAA
ncbi:hypothetical protein KIPE111705_36870 [Kibdelosporangium persicum]|uniref:hypothetical protein n=1 Tax=Kibdelosporangium persicum TaxID=2698649 RepID=UPI0015660EAE|nr:hypothetical protein [Kibdelosporangium persicum]